MDMEVFIVIALILLALKLIDYYNKRERGEGERHMDNKGYMRDGYGVLVHRKVAFNYIYNKHTYPLRFGAYDIHHIDRNKTNNNPSNLQILTREQHKAIHKIE